MRTVLMVIGSAAVAFGLVWIVQSGGWTPWPPTRFALPNMRWLTFGALPVLGGFTLLTFARRL